MVVTDNTEILNFARFDDDDNGDYDDDDDVGDVRSLEG